MALLKPEPLHFLLIPLMAPGHIIPMIDMAKVLAKHDIDITIIVTPLDYKRFSPVIDRAVTSGGLSIQLQEIEFPAEEAGLPRGCESTDCLPSYNLIRNFFVAITLLQQPMEEILKEMSPSPSCIICDKHVAWVADTCEKFNIPRIIFDGMGCFANLVMHTLYVSKIYETVEPEEIFVIPGLHDKVEVTKEQLPGYFNPGSIYINDFRKQIIDNESRAYGIIVNSFEELEKRYFDELKKLKGGRAWCVGPLSLCNNESLLDRAERGNQASADTQKCLEWLDGKNPGSVIYACLGSLNRISPSQFVELALGLESSNHPFILVVKGGDRFKEMEKWISDEGFEERNNERGFLIRGWAPQVMILSHSSIGAFLTHCGWNSSLEGLSSGVPMITWPMFAEQFLNEKLIVQILEVGVGVGSEQAVQLGDEEKADRNNKVKRDGINSAIQRVMDKGKEGSARRKRAKQLGERAKRSVQEGGSSDLNVKMLIQEIEHLVKEKL